MRSRSSCNEPGQGRRCRHTWGTAMCSREAQQSASRWLESGTKGTRTSRPTPRADPAQRECGQQREFGITDTCILLCHPPSLSTPPLFPHSHRCNAERQVVLAGQAVQLSLKQVGATDRARRQPLLRLTLVRAPMPVRVRACARVCVCVSREFAKGQGRETLRPRLLRTYYHTTTRDRWQT